MWLGPTQLQPGPAIASGLQTTIALILATFGGMQQALVPATPNIGAHLVTTAPYIEVPSTYVVALPVILATSMTVAEQKILGRFLTLAPPWFSRAIEEDAHEFRTSCRERLYTLGLVESIGLDYTAYQLDGQARQWWHMSTDYRLVGPPLKRPFQKDATS